MKIAIIGAGWVGCHIAKTLLDKCEIDIYEKDGVFSSTSFYNQNRLHFGFHYARNQRTRNLCKETFDRFLCDYGDFVNDVSKNIYSIPHLSLLDFETYSGIYNYEKIPFTQIDLKSLRNIEGSINTKEKHINYRGLKRYFQDLLGSRIKKVNVNNVKDIKDQYDFIINCTNNFLDRDSQNSFYEVSLSLIYEKIGNTEFDSLTLVDGNFFSIYPYHENLYTLTDVEFTPMITDESLDFILAYKNRVDDKLVEEKKIKIVDKVLNYFPEFNEKFKYKGYFTSIKSKTYNGSADRYPIINRDGNVISCFTGKIQGIYIIEKEIKKILSDEIRRA
jgi:hypothetical protein